MVTSKFSFGRHVISSRSVFSLKNSCVNWAQASETGSDSLFPYRMHFNSLMFLESSAICSTQSKFQQAYSQHRKDSFFNSNTTKKPKLAWSQHKPKHVRAQIGLDPDIPIVNVRWYLFLALALLGIRGGALCVDEEIACLADDIGRRARLGLEETLHPLALTTCAALAEAASKLLREMLTRRRRRRREPRHRPRGSPRSSLFGRTDSYCVFVCVGFCVCDRVGRRG